MATAGSTSAEGGGGAGADSTPSSPSVASEVPFHDVCSLMETVNRTSGVERKKKVFATFVGKWREAHSRLHPADSSTTKDTFYAAMRLLLPQLDRGRPAYGLKETALAKQYIEILNIAKESTDAKKLLNYRAPHTAKQEAGDFAAVAFFVLRNRCPEKGSLTVAQVNQYLDDLALSNTKKDRPGMRKALQLMLRNTSATEQKWLIRIILKELKTGMSENSVFSVFHPDASDLFSVCSSLEQVCSALRDRDTHLNEASISYFTPFRPMLGQRASIDQVSKLMDHQPFFMEIKFDGDRMQLHRQDNQYRYYSRSSRDYTRSFGASPYEGSFTPHIHSAFNSKVKSCILDGEMVGWDPETESFMPKGENVDVKAIGMDDESGAQQCFVVFDVLMINDKVLANCPLRERAEHLKKTFQPVKGYLHMVERQEASTKEDVIIALNEAIDRREEGLLVKAPHSTYQPDKRKGSGWLKIKPEYVDSLSDQLDLVIIGGYYGVGRRSGMMSHFMCGVAVPPRPPADKPSTFHSFCKVGSGYSMAELKDLGMKLRSHWKKFDTKHPPDCIRLAPGFKEKPDLWIEPWKSKIVQIRAAEIVASDKYMCGCTLRFPRVEKVREDKDWFDCMTVDELEQLKMLASGRLAHEHMDDSDLGPATKKRKVASSRIERPRGVAAQFRPTDISDVHKVSRMFEEKEFCVINGPRGMSKEEMERKIAEHGGTFVQNPGQNTYCVVVHKVIVRANNIISTGLYDVVRSEWLQECLTAGLCLPFLPHHMLHTSPSTASKFAQQYDQHGDSYTDDVTEQTLMEVFKKVEKEEVAVMESRYTYFQDENPKGLFRQCKFYLDKYTEIGNTATAIAVSSLELTALDLRSHGGEISEDFSEGVTHVILDKSDLSRVSRLRGVEHSHRKKHHFVTQQWVVDSIEDNYLKPERLYEPQT